MLFDLNIRVNDIFLQQIELYSRKVLFPKLNHIGVGERIELLRKTVSGMLLTLVLISMLTLAFNIRQVKATSTSFIVTKTKILDPGDNLIHGFVYYGGYLWASTRTSPCRILKIDPNTLDYERIILDAGLNSGDALIAADGYIWAILDTSPSKIIRVDPETLAWEVAVAFQSNELSLGESLEYAFGHLWAGGAYGKIARINLIGLTYELYSYPSAGDFSYFAALISGDGYIWAQAVHYSDWQGRYYASTVIRFNPTNPSDYTSVYISGGAMADDVAFVGGHFYTGSETSPSYVYKISDSLTYSSAEISDTLCYDISANNNHIWGAYVGSPGKAVELDLNLNIIATYQMPVGFNDANEIAFDTVGNMYVTCWESPAKIVKFSPILEFTGKIYIKADGSIDPSDAPISTVDYVTYTLTGNIRCDGIVVERNNIAIDGTKHWVQGTGADESKGIDLSGRTNVAVRNTQITNFYYGIYLNYSSDNIILENNMTNNRGDGVILSHSSSNSIIRNNLTNNLDGIGLVESEDNRICENNASDNTSSGIYLWLSNRNRIVWNEVDFNNLGIWLGESTENIICHNNFTDNNQQSSIYSPGYSNIWNDVYPSGGNYWSDYTERYPDASELDASGIWDTPYVIDANNQDNYPLVNPCVLARIVKNLAEACIDKPYLSQYGNALTKGWDGRFVDPEEIEYLDCSGLVYWSYNKAYWSTEYSPYLGSYIAIDEKEVIFHNPIAFEGAELQYRYNCEIIVKEDLETGDLLFFNTADPTDPDHVAMYVGGPFTYNYVTKYGEAKAFEYNVVEATAWGDNKVVPAFYSAEEEKLVTLRPSTGDTSGNTPLGRPNPFRVDYYGRVRRFPIDITYKRADVLGILVKSPVKLVVTDPEGFTVTSDFREASSMVYLELDTDGDNELDDMVIVLGHKVGDYTIQVVPKPDAVPDDTYTLEVSVGNTTIVMAQNVSIADIPSNPYIVTSNETGIIPRLDPHDIGITGLATTKKVVGEGFSLHGNVSIFNYGSFAETFNVTLFANETIIAASTNITLTSRNSTTVTFTWDTSGFFKGNYAISAYAWPVQGETNMDDNTFTDGWVIVAMVGDITGPDGWPDGKVDMIYDIRSVAKLFGVAPPDPRYNPNYDINGDGKVDMINDIRTVAKHFGDVDP